MYERTFDTSDLHHELDAIRRSAAIGNGITRDDADRLLALCDRLLLEREQIQTVLGELGPSWTEARAALNRLARIVR